MSSTPLPTSHIGSTPGNGGMNMGSSSNRIIGSQSPNIYQNLLLDSIIRDGVSEHNANSPNSEESRKKQNAAKGSGSVKPEANNLDPAQVYTNPELNLLKQGPEHQAIRMGLGTGNTQVFDQTREKLGLGTFGNPNAGVPQFQPQTTGPMSMNNGGGLQHLLPPAPQPQQYINPVPAGGFNPGTAPQQFMSQQMNQPYPWWR